MFVENPTILLTWPGQGNNKRSFEVHTDKPRLCILLPKGSPCILSGQFLNINFNVLSLRHTRTSLLEIFCRIIIIWHLAHLKMNLTLKYFFKNPRKIKLVKICSICRIEAIHIFRTVLYIFIRVALPPLSHRNEWPCSS